MTALLQKACLAIGTLDGKLSSSRLRDGWACRRRISATVAAAAADGIKIDPSRLVRLLTGLHVVRWRDFGAEAAAIRIFGETAGQGEAADLLVERVGEVSVSNVVSATLAAVEAGMPRSSAFIAFPFVLRRLGLTEHVLVGVSPLASSGQSDQALLDSAVRGRRELETLSLSWSRWTRALGRRNSNSRHLLVLAAAASMTAVAPAQIARMLGMTVRGAALLLAEMVELGIMREVSGRETWQVFQVEDMPGKPEEKSEEIDMPDLAALMTDLDSVMRQVEKRLEPRLTEFNELENGSE